MKISSVSKKVLASALSAAMVVAFAPTVAFGAQQYEKVTLSYDFAGGQVVSGQGIASTAEKTVDGSKEVTVDNISNYEKGGYAFKGWFVDANENGLKDTGEAVVTSSESWKLDVADVAAGSTVKLVAQYDAPAFAAATSKAGTGASTAQLAVGINASTAIIGHNYKVAITKGGAEVATASYTDAELKAAGSLKLEFAAKAAALSGGVVTAAESAFGAGVYTFTLTDTTKSIELSKAEIEVVAVNASGNGTLIKQANGQYTSSIDFYAIAGESWADALTNASLANTSLQTYSNAIESGTGAQVKNSNGKYALEGYYAGTTKVLEITSTDKVTAVSGAKVESGKGSIVAQYASSKFTAELAYNEGGNTLTATATPAAGDDYDSYKITVASPAGAVLGTETTTRAAKMITVNFGTIEPGAGVYTATLYGVKGTGADATETKIDESAATLVKIAFAGGEATATSAAVPAAGVTDATEITKANLDSYHGAAYFNAPTGKAFDAWTVDGKPITYVDNANKTAKVWKVSPGADYTVTLTATWKAAAQTKAVAPGYTYADGKLTLANAAGSNYDVWYTTDGTTPTTTDTKYSATGTGLVVDATNFNGIVKAKALPVAAPTGAVYSDGDELVVTGYAYLSAGKTELIKFSDQLVGLGAAQPSDSTATAPKYWDKVLKATTDAGTAAIKAVGYASAEDWAKVQAAQKKAVVDAAAAYEDAALDGKAAAVKAADGKTYTFATADQIAAAKAKVKVVTDAFAENTDGDSDYVDLTGKKTTKATADGYIAADYVKAITAAANKVETETVPAADYDAAGAVTAKLKAATTAEAAKDALAKYEALTAAQKQLVPAADIVAAQEIVAAAELKDAQDDAAVSKTRDASKTVKAGKNGKTAKKQSVTLKAITSKSGAKVTYKKSSGSSKVSVKSGKAYLAKGVKKGTYKATVKATCGTQTAKIKVTFKVK